MYSNQHLHLPYARLIHSPVRNYSPVHSVISITQLSASGMINMRHQAYGDHPSDDRKCPARRAHQTFCTSSVGIFFVFATTVSTCVCSLAMRWTLWSMARIDVAISCTRACVLVSAKSAGVRPS